MNTFISTINPDLSNLTLTEQRALEMLGNGMSTKVAASAAGVSESRISQLLATEDFAEQVAARKYARLQAATARDKKYDSMEDKLLDKLEKNICFMTKTNEIINSLKLVNGAERRGIPVQEAGIGQAVSHTVQIVIPVTALGAIGVDFNLNANNQVVQAGEQSLLTIQSSNLSKMLGAQNEQQAEQRQQNTEKTEKSRQPQLTANEV